MAMFIIIIVIIIIFATRSKYKYKPDAGAFFFEDDKLVLNAGMPCYISLDQIEWVELYYSSWEVEHKPSYGLIIKVIKKDGKSDFVFYKSDKTEKLALPSDMVTALQEKGIYGIMIDV